MAPSNPDSIELVEYPTSPRLSANARGASSETSRARARPFRPAANSQSLVGLRTSVEEAAQEKLPPTLVRVSRLSFWAEALRRRALNSGNVDSQPAKMKFSHSVQFNAVPEWSSNYIAYSNLKKLYVTFDREKAGLVVSHCTEAHGPWRIVFRLTSRD